MIRKIVILMIWAICFAEAFCFADESQIQWNTQLDTLQTGIRYDDNIFGPFGIQGSPDPGKRLSDVIDFVNWGALIEPSYDIFDTRFAYELDGAQYWNYVTLDNLKNDFNLSFKIEPKDWNLYYIKDYYIRSSSNSNFNYFDDDNLAGMQWTPQGPWIYGFKYKNFYRQYYDTSNIYQAQNFQDQGIQATIQREIDPKITFKMEAGFDYRQFGRDAVEKDSSGDIVALNCIQTDQSWNILLTAQIYMNGVLQNITLEHQRTNSNSYGFSNTVDSIAWAAVFKPNSSLFLETLIRLYSKAYDQTPIALPDLQVGLVDEDSQGVLSIKATWDMDNGWSSSLNLSHDQNETTYPGQYYIKNLIEIGLRHDF